VAKKSALLSKKKAAIEKKTTIKHKALYNTLGAKTTPKAATTATVAKIQNKVDSNK
jgi:DNA-binding phage protein